MLPNKYIKSLKINKRAVTSALIISTFALTVTSCGPRGESKSLQQVFQRALKEYKQYKDEGTPLNSEVADNLKSITKLLQNITVAKKLNEIGPDSQRVAKLLQQLVPATGYTSRPALTEIIEQYNSVAQASSKINDGSDSKEILSKSELDMDAVKLLVARTFFLLASELKTVRFQLLEREKKSA